MQTPHLLEYDGCVNFMKGAIEMCRQGDHRFSPAMRAEILDPWYSHGLDGLLRQKQYKLCGILNGIDTKSYDPATDPATLPKTIRRPTFKAHKLACKEELQSVFGLHDWPVPVLAMVTRLVGHKGVDLVRHVAQEVVNNGIQLVVLGSGESEYESFFSELAARNPGAVGVRIGFVPSLARKVYAGADMFLMPSKSEPCGLSQMVALRDGAPFPLCARQAACATLFTIRATARATVSPSAITMPTKCWAPFCAPKRALKSRTAGACW